MRNSDLSPNTLKVLKGLIKKGYEAYAVGGCVRDRLLGQQPKDFDVVSNATPEQIKACFRNCRLIGKRFRLAHITFGREIIEVATFRGHHSDDSQDKLAKKNEDGQLLRDNIFGSINEDAARRDFTFNAMYFDVSDESILDFAKGFESIKQNTIKMIGNSETRFREDPVRMIRAIRFSCKLNMSLPQALSDSICENAHLLANIPPARLFEEANKLLLSGKGLITFESLLKHKLLAQLFPQLVPFLNDQRSKEYQLLLAMLRNTDQRIASDQRVTPAFLYATFLWYPMEEKSESIMFESQINKHDAINLASAEVLFKQTTRIMIPKRFSVPVRDIWHLQLRLQNRQGRRCMQLLNHPKFRAAFDFLSLRGEVEGGHLMEIAEWWKSFQEVGADEKSNMLKALAPSSRPRRKRRSKKRND